MINRINHSFHSAAFCTNGPDGEDGFGAGCKPGDVGLGEHNLRLEASVGDEEGLVVFAVLMENIGELCFGWGEGIEMTYLFIAIAEDLGAVGQMSKGSASLCEIFVTKVGPWKCSGEGGSWAIVVGDEEADDNGCEDSWQQAREGAVHLLD